MLSPRLKQVAAFVSSAAVLADIGSDHAYLPCALALDGRIAKAYAAEVKEGPLKQSKKTIAQYGLEDIVFPLLSDGLANIPDDVDEVVIAGMGAHTVLAILQASLARLANYKRIIIQVNQHMELIRAYLSERQFMILEEALVQEEDKYYPILVWQATQDRILRPEEILFGPKLLEQQGELFHAFYQKRYQAYEAILPQLLPGSDRHQQLVQEMHLMQTHILEKKRVERNT